MAKRVFMEEQEPPAENPSEFCVSIKTLDSQTFSVLVSPNDTVRELKVKLNAQDPSRRPEYGRMIYNQREMEDYQTLQYYNVTPNSVLYHVQRLRGGGYLVAQSGLSPRRQSAIFESALSDEASGSTEESYLLEQHHPWQNMDSPLQGNCQRCVGMDFPKVTPEIIQESWKYRSVYRAYLPGAGIFQCSITGLSFRVKSAVTITYRYATWTKHLSKADQETWVPAGPLFRIQVQPGVVEAVHLPHFICLAEYVDTSLCSIAHFKSEKMTLERPTRLIPFFAVLENPSFSLLGVLWRKLRSTLNSLPVHSSVLIFQQLSAANTTLHLYLIPDDKSVKQAIEKQEMDWNSKIIPKPPPFRPLFLGCLYRVTSTNSVEIMPEEQLPFCYRSPKEQQLFFEIYIRNMAEEIQLRMTDTRNDTEVWRASLRSGDINPLACASKTLSGAAFMKKHKTSLCLRIRQLSPILLHLRHENVINSDEEEEVQSKGTSQRKNQFLLDLVEKKGQEAQQQFYQILRMKNPYLIADLEKSN